MKKSKYSKIALAAIIGAALIQAGPALAKQASADDNLSVYEYGPWGTMGAPAAGTEPATPLPGPNVAAVTFRDNPAQIVEVKKDAPVEVGPCAAGAPCGWTYEKDGYGGDYAEGALALARFEIPKLVLEPLDEGYGTDYGEGIISEASFKVSEPVFKNHGHLPIDSLLMVHSDTYYGLDGWYYAGEYRTSGYRNYNNNSTPAWFDALNTALGNDGASRPDWLVNIYTYGYDQPSENSDYRQSKMWGDISINVPAWELDLKVGEWEDYTYYTNGDMRYQTGYFVQGTTTTQVALDSRSGEVQVDYTGTTVINGTPWTASLNFRDHSWNAAFNDGADGKTSYPDSANNNIVGNVGFFASGKIVGPNLKTTSITAKDGIIDMNKSALQMALFGDKGHVLAGAGELVKTSTGTTDSGVSTGIADGRYTNRQWGDIVIAVENSVARQQTR